MRTTVYKVDKQQGPLVSTENYIQYLAIACNGRKSDKECVGGGDHFAVNLKHVVNRVCFSLKTGL